MGFYLRIAGGNVLDQSRSWIAKFSSNCLFFINIRSLMPEYYKCVLIHDNNVIELIPDCVHMEPFVSV
jgi:hypothetical protein